MAIDAQVRQRVLYLAGEHAKAGQGVPQVQGALLRTYSRYRAVAEWRAVLRGDVAEVG